MTEIGTPIGTSDISPLPDDSLRKRVLWYIKTFPNLNGVPINRIVRHFQATDVDCRSLSPKDCEEEKKRIESNIRTYIKQFVKKGILRKVSRGIYAFNFDVENQDRDTSGGRSSGVSQNGIDAVWDDLNSLEKGLVRILLDYDLSHGWELWVDDFYLVKEFVFRGDVKVIFEGNMVYIQCSDSPLNLSELQFLSGFIAGVVESHGGSGEKIFALKFDLNRDLPGFEFDHGDKVRIRFETVVNVAFQVYTKRKIGVMRSEAQFWFRKKELPFLKAVNTIMAARDSVNASAFLYSLMNYGKEIISALGIVGHNIVNSIDQVVDTVLHNELVLNDLKYEVSQSISQLSQNVNEVATYSRGNQEQLLVLNDKVDSLSEDQRIMLQIQANLSEGFYNISETMNQLTQATIQSNNEIIHNVSSLAAQLREIREKLDTLDFRWEEQTEEIRRIWVFLQRLAGRSLREIGSIAGVSHETIRRYANMDIPIDMDPREEPVEQTNRVTSELINEPFNENRGRDERRIIEYLRNNPNKTIYEIRRELRFSSYSYLKSLLLSLVSRNILGKQTDQRYRRGRNPTVYFVRGE